MTTRSAALAISALVAAAALTACSTDDTEQTDSEQSSAAALATCRTVAVADASLSGTRKQLSQGYVDDSVAASYTATIDLVSDTARDPDLPADLAALAITYIKNLDQSRALTTQVSVAGINTAQLSASAVREYRAGQAVSEACAEAPPGDALPEQE